MAHLSQNILLLMMLVPATLACVRSLGGGATYDGPDQCHGLQCPRYRTVTEVPKKYEKRVYEPAKWVSTTVMGLTHDEATSTGFMRLFDYIDGENDEKKKVEMTAPVAVRVIPGQGPACETNFTIYFFVPFEYQEAANPPPNPSNPNISIVDFPELTVYVGKFGGRAEDDDWIENETKLGNILIELGITFEESVYYTAGYDSPFRLWYRHNEVWLLAKDAEDAGDTNVIESL
nr:heme-binding protein 2-like [Lytechinus pictus]XP_054769740.1 heme-binding protein 2-like [Lytechinus pictus]